MLRSELLEDIRNSNGDERTRREICTFKNRQVGPIRKIETINAEAEQAEAAFYARNANYAFLTA